MTAGPELKWCVAGINTAGYDGYCFETTVCDTEEEAKETAKHFEDPKITQEWRVADGMIWRKP